ncbi:Detected protein of unknown function [Hibiscus syriacus]|uniref:SOSEKI DIX-like domain-containing protein n=1 Tax=Hibiscus syriacus TaxID=106335 RepID=A0A6A2WZ83_HIBSY|nr:Detected protein of unknown function [Hibiscus syriacus]
MQLGLGLLMETRMKNIGKNRQLEHPHFIEVALSSPDGLYLRDVIERLNNLRGRGMSSMYSWSCKRSYRNGFVWHDLSEDDLILPAHGNEYVLKGSELFEESNSDHFSPVGNSSRLQNLKQLPEPPSSSRSQDDSSSSSSMNEKRTKNSQDDELSSPVNRPTPGSSDASTQTEENTDRPKTRETCTRGVSTDDGSIEPVGNVNFQNQIPNPCLKDNSEICRNPVSPPSTSSSSSTGGKTETLESLIRADASKINSFRILEEEDIRMPTNARLKATSMLMQLISCGSISVKDHKSEADGPEMEDKEYFSGSLIETKMLKQEAEGHTTLKRSSSYNDERSCKELESAEDKEETNLGHTKCIPRSIKASISKQPRSESMRSPISDKPRNSSDGIHNPRSVSSSTSAGSSRIITEPVVNQKQSKRLDSFREEEQACFRSSGYNPIQDAF